MKFKNIVFSLFFVTSFLAQFFLQLHHAFGDHNHRVCHSVYLKHVHQKDVDCDLHLYKNASQDITVFEYQFLNKIEISSIDTLQKNFLKNHQQLSFSLRGPPQNVLI